MLKQLRIQNIILIESAEIPFEPGLNVLSGETGSGKSALMNSLNLIAGERTDVGMIRRGAEKGVVEAIFEVEENLQLKTLLEESGIDHDSGEELIIRREISAAGKSRAFINNQMAQLGLLKKVSGVLLDIVGQHANQKLFSVENHREILDLYGDLKEEITRFSKSWEEENKQRSKLEELIRNEAQRLRDMEMYEREFEEISSANLLENEEEELFAEYTLLTNAEEISSKVLEISQVLSGEKQNALAFLSRQKNTFEQLVRIDPSLADSAKSFENAVMELQEVAYTVRNYQSRIEHNPERAAEVNERLSLINRLKKRYGNSISEIQTYQQQILEKLNLLQDADQHIEELQNSLKILSEQNDRLSQDLTLKRHNAAKNLEKAVIHELRQLNMPKVEFHAIIKSQKRNRFGDDFIEFFISPNVGEHQIPVKDCASGGELSRVMLALQSLLAGKEQVPSLIFDEIDANIGGETASIVGEKLKEIGKKHQVLCITHFPQVAKQADHHLQISKREQEGRTITLVKELSESERKKELSRMTGSSQA